MNAGMRLVAAAALLVLLAAGAGAEEVAGLPVHIQRLDAQTVRVWVGDTISSTATVAIATDEGIVVIDTTGDPGVDGELRKIIARELGRDDFKYLINTHEHGDHCGGNGVYADCVIVAHELVGEAMIAQAGRLPESMEWRTARIADLEREVASLPPDSVAARKRLQEDLTLNRLGLETLRSGLRPPLPTKTFSDRMKLELGGTTFELYYIGGMHSASDIAVFVPEHGLLMTGDTMADVWLTDTPGCLASFVARSGVRHDFPLMLENWNRLLARKDAIKKLVPGHWNGELSLAGCEARVNYVRALWEGTNRAVKEGHSLSELQAEFRLDRRFPELAQSRGFSLQGHYLTVVELWSTVTGQESAAQRIFILVNEGGDEDSIRQILAARDAKPVKYFFLEPEFIGMGYGLLQEERVPQAIRMFKLAVEIFPESWNAYDSLGEALWKGGETDAAVKMYEKSLELNPNNENGKEVLARIRAAG